MRSAVELSSAPTADTPGIFADWAVSAKGNSVSFDDDRIVWDFGADFQYPALCPIDADGDGRFTSAEFGMQPRDTGIAHVYFAQSDFVVGETDGMVEVSVVMLNAPDTAVDVSVLVSDGTATAPDDYAYDSDAVVLSFDSSDAIDFLTTRTFAITIHTDDISELNENILLSFSTPPGGVVLAEPSMSRVVIVDDDVRNPYDTDGDGLIEVHTIEQLNVIRYDCDGDGEIDDSYNGNLEEEGSEAAAYVAAFGHDEFPSDEGDYVGYELAAALDFAGTRWALHATADSIPDAVLEGWAPIGTSKISQYTAIFEGNEHTITGLCIYRPSTENVAFFGYAGADAIIRNVFLEEVYVHGGKYVGGLVGISFGDITSSYASGAVTGTDR